jgi:hypothetical protein
MPAEDVLAEAVTALRQALLSRNGDACEAAVLAVLHAGSAPSAEASAAALEALLDSCDRPGAASTE